MTEPFNFSKNPLQGSIEATGQLLRSEHFVAVGALADNPLTHTGAHALSASPANLSFIPAGGVNNHAFTGKEASSTERNGVREAMITALSSQWETSRSTRTAATMKEMTAQPAHLATLLGPALEGAVSSSTIQNFVNVSKRV